MDITNKDIPNKFIELNKFLNNVCIIWVNHLLLNLGNKIINFRVENTCVGNLEEREIVVGSGASLLIVNTPHALFVLLLPRTKYFDGETLIFSEHYCLDNMYCQDVFPP